LAAIECGLHILVFPEPVTPDRVAGFFLSGGHVQAEQTCGERYVRFGNVVSTPDSLVWELAGLQQAPNSCSEVSV
jgi:hypothetical protein